MVLILFWGFIYRRFYIISFSFPLSLHHRLLFSYTSLYMFLSLSLSANFIKFDDWFLLLRQHLLHGYFDDCAFSVFLRTGRDISVLLFIILIKISVLALLVLISMLLPLLVFRRRIAIDNHLKNASSPSRRLRDFVWPHGFWVEGLLTLVITVDTKQFLMISLHR